jgi:hypothetical protein
MRIIFNVPVHTVDKQVRFFFVSTRSQPALNF